MKNIYLVILSILFSLLLVYILLFSWVVIQKKYISKYNFSNSETLNFHKYYSNKLHHLRGKHFEIDTQRKEDYIFTVISEFSNGKINFLIQGDSWAEYLVTKKKTKEKLIEIANKRNIGLINGGIASFSPTPMKIQLDLLNQDFDLKPDVIISFIDQTDIGDELCRYKSKLKRNNQKKVVSIDREINTGAVFDYSKYYRFSEIINKNQRFQNIYITNYYFEKFFKELLYKLKNLNNQSYLCKFNDISRYLYNINDNEKKYFKQTLLDYVEKINKDEKIKKIFLISFPHKNHLNNTYSVNVSTLIDKISLPKKIEHLNFTKIIRDNNFIGEDLYEPLDEASHLSELSQTKLIEFVFDYIFERARFDNIK